MDLLRTYEILQHLLQGGRCEMVAKPCEFAGRMLVCIETLAQIRGAALSRS